ncbi:dimethylarginine dimethylaminohydrolase family protein [Tsuneonella sp. HG249]
MKMDFSAGTALTESRNTQPFGHVRGETRRLTDVALCPPRYLAPVPCCSVTKESIREGFETDTARAVAQHSRLRKVLLDSGVACHSLPPATGHADMCFTRDVAAATPWGVVALNPALGHRSSEVDRFVAWASASLGEDVARIRDGHIEGGDICVARPGLLIIGVSGARTEQRGAEEFAAPFEAEGWDVVRCPFDEHFLHLDTIFCMLDERRALACVDVLDDDFLAEMAARQIELLPVSYKEARRLGCNVLSIDGRTIIAAAGAPRVSQMMRDRGFLVHELELDELTACGGGVHCLTLPLRRGNSRNRVL